MTPDALAPSEHNRHCFNCPRQCGVIRDSQNGFCEMGDEMRMARVMRHYGEEPFLGGAKGVVNIFFSGCNLRCIFCQNSVISCGSGYGVKVTIPELTQDIMNLTGDDDCLVSFVSPTIWINQIALLCHSLRQSGFKGKIAYNSNCYDDIAALRQLDGLIDIYLPDLKFRQNNTAQTLAKANDYFRIASLALKEMVRQVGTMVWHGDVLSRGVVVRHLVLPHHLIETRLVLKWLDAHYANSIVLSLMSQYQPAHQAFAHDTLDQTLSADEYKDAIAYADGLSFAYVQSQTPSEGASMTPLFDGSGIKGKPQPNSATGDIASLNRFVWPPLVLLLLEKLKACGEEAWLVGGCVRDCLLGIATNDYDIATSATPQIIKDILSNATVTSGLTTVDCFGEKQGSIAIMFQNGAAQIQITTMHQESGYGDFRHPDQVEWVRNIEVDLNRRDFTINALAYHPEHGLRDPLCGQKDLINRVLSLIGAREERLQEDPLRILRAARFAAIHRLIIEPQLAFWMNQNANLTSKIPAVHIGRELLKLMGGLSRESVLSQFHQMFEVMLPELMSYYVVMQKLFGMNAQGAYTVLLDKLEQAKYLPEHGMATLVSTICIAEDGTYDCRSAASLLIRLQLTRQTKQRILQVAQMPLAR